MGAGVSLDVGGYQFYDGGVCFKVYGMKQKMIWNENELVFEDDINKGVAGIAPTEDDELGMEIAKRWNEYNSMKLEIMRLKYELKNGTCMDCGSYDIRTPMHDSSASMPDPICNKCDFEFATCHAKNVLFSINVNKDLRGAEADIVLDCDHYKKEQSND
jgi:hypothetical protein